VTLTAPTLAQPAPAASVTAAEPATVTVDFNQSRGRFRQPERYNNFSRATNWTAQRDADVRFLNEQGLHGKVYKVWVDAERIYDPKTNSYDYTGIDDYLADASLVSDELLMVMDTRVSIRDLGRSPADIKPIIKRIMMDLKRRFPQIRYIEAFNEPDHNLAKSVTPAGLYDYYKVYYEAVNEINREVQPLVPLEIGGPAYMQYNEKWLRAFLDRYAADPSRDKRLDFISWHAYGAFPEGTGESGGPRAYHFYKEDPSEVAGQRRTLESELASRKLDTHIPAFITETGMYPGPSFDNQNDPRPDYLIGAAGVPAMHYWYLEQPNIYPFNWVVRHSSEERKDQLITRAHNGEHVSIRAGEKIQDPPTNVFTPYGNAMKMMAMLKTERVAASSSALSQGKGIYSIATKDKYGAAIMVWNYQHVRRQSYQVSIDMNNLSANLRGKSVCQKMYRIDDKVSNYWADPHSANLQQIAAARVVPGQGYKLSVLLTPNALQLITLEPAQTCSS
jgi:hypothetical protein